jgi:hypothetical protein
MSPDTLTTLYEAGLTATPAERDLAERLRTAATRVVQEVEAGVERIGPAAGLMIPATLVEVSPSSTFFSMLVLTLGVQVSAMVQELPARQRLEASGRLTNISLPDRMVHRLRVAMAKVAVSLNDALPDRPGMGMAALGVAGGISAAAFQEILLSAGAGLDAKGVLVVAGVLSGALSASVLPAQTRGTTPLR